MTTFFPLDTCVCWLSFLSVFLPAGAVPGGADMVFSVGNAAQDLESFASHAGRKTIKTDDVMLLTRRNEGLETIMKDFVEKLKVQNAERKRADAAAGAAAGKRKLRD